MRLFGDDVLRKLSKQKEAFDDEAFDDEAVEAVDEGALSSVEDDEAVDDDGAGRRPEATHCRHCRFDCE